MKIYILEYALEYLIDEMKHTCANQSLRANFNLSHQINIQGEAQREWKGGFAKCDYPIQERAVNCKITQTPHAPWMLIQWQIGVYTVRLVCT